MATAKKPATKTSTSKTTTKSYQKQPTKSTSSKSAMNRFKTEVASELGVNLKEGYNGDLTTKQAGSVGGEMVKRMIDKQKQSMKY